MKSVLVTGVGGVVGQGILRCIRSLNRDIRLHGTDVRGVSAGNHLCDSVREVPYAYDDAYIPAIAAIVRDLDVRLIIPSTDYEIHFLAQYADEIGAPVAASPAWVSALCL